MARLLQWLRERMSPIHRIAARHDSHTVRHEVIVQTEERTLLLCSVHMQDASVCPLCGCPLLELTGQNSSENSGDQNDERPGRLR